ncbi:DUF4062 domain-containing protein [Brevundimonas sp. NPDC092305]|uniref:DUF4062 domain-containing protein n=1 Tax=Brevundimonas sp. NPDC092305 TaxID=3363957 RepID=UPI00380E69C6
MFLASPGDLGDERQFARDCVAEWNSVNAERTGWLVELLGWEDTLPQAGRPQELINRDVRRCMLFVGMMHRHWGSETGNGYTSGFHEEFTLASGLYESEGRPRIALFFKNPGAVGDPGEQLKQVLAFKDTIKTSKKYLYKELESEAAAWQSGFRRNLHKTIFELIDELDVGSQVGDAATETPEPANAADDRNPSASETGQGLRLVEIQSLVERLAGISPADDVPAEEIARLRLLGASWHVAGLSETYLGTHDANVILRGVATSKLSTPEVMGLIETGLANIASQTTPLWRWVAREDTDFDYLKALAIWGDDDTLRIGALKVLAWGKVPLDLSSFPPDRMGESGTPLRDAFYEYLSQQDGEDSLSLLQAEFQKADYKNEVALVAALLRRLSRQSSDAPIRFLALDNVTPPYGRRSKPDWASLSHFTDDELRTAFRHRDANVRREAAIQLGRRDLLSHDEKLALRNDPSASLRAAGVQIAIEDGEALSLMDAERIIVRRAKNALMQSPEGTHQYEQVRKHLLETFTNESLLKEADEIYQPAEDAYEILLRRGWKGRADAARRAVREGFKSHFDDILARRRAVLGDAAAALALPANLGVIYEYRASSMIRAALNVIGEKGGKIDLSLFRHALTTPYFHMVESDFLFFGKYGEWSDIPAIARASRSKGSLLNPEYVVPVETVAATIVRIAKGRERELLALDLPDDVRVALLKRLPKAAFARLPEPLLVTMLNLKADSVRRVVAIRCARDLTKARCEKLLSLCYAEGTYFYNVVHWLDLAVSMARPVVEQVTTSLLLDD